MADDAKTLQERRRELLRRRIAESGMAAPESAKQARIRAGERYPLSAGQRRMWFLQTMDAGDVTLNICVAYRLTGALDEARLRAAFNDVIARHAILRTTYCVDSEGEPYQVFSDDVEISWRTDDLTQLPEKERERQIEAVARDEFGRPFDLTDELPLRITPDPHRRRRIRAAAGRASHLLGRRLLGRFLPRPERCLQRSPTERRCATVRRGRGARMPAAEPTIADVGYWADTLRPSPEPLELPGAAAAHPSRRAERRTRALPADLFGRVEDFARAALRLAVHGVAGGLRCAGASLYRRDGFPDLRAGNRASGCGRGRHRVLRQHAVAADRRAIAGHLYLVRRRGTRNMS